MAEGRTAEWLLRPGLLACSAARGIEAELRRYRDVAALARGRELEHPRHVALAEDRIAEYFVVHVAPLGGKPGVLDVAHDLDFVHAVAGAGRADDVFLDHHAAHVVRAVREA